ncbi:MAG: nucleoside-diphosphate kinase, partial [Candidatus Humimicrobiaceae bacterium]
MNLKTEKQSMVKSSSGDKKKVTGIKKISEKSEKSLIIIKPDGVKNKVVGKIISRFENAGLEIERIRVLEIDKSIAYTHYNEHEGKPYFERLINYMTSGPSIVLIIKGE